MAANRNDWKTTPLPAARVGITLDRTYAADEFARIKEGDVPQEMEDKWFAFYEEPWLYLHRSWTGFGIYQVSRRHAPSRGRRRSGRRARAAVRADRRRWPRG